MSSLVLPPPGDLKGRVEYALAREYYKVPILRSITPQMWRSNARKKEITLAIQCNPPGAEMVPGTGIYQVEVQVSVQGRVTKTDPSKYIAEVEKLHASYGQMYLNADSAGYNAIFLKWALQVFWALPLTNPATIENMSRQENAGLTMCAMKLG